jgi:hypothetical protein
VGMENVWKNGLQQNPRAKFVESGEGNAGFAKAESYMMKWRWRLRDCTGVQMQNVSYVLRTAMVKRPCGHWTATTEMFCRER